MTDVLAKSRALDAGNQTAARVILADPAKYGSDGIMVEWAKRMTGQVVDSSSDPAMLEPGKAFANRS